MSCIARSGCPRTRGSSASRARSSATTPGGRRWPNRPPHSSWQGQFDAHVWAEFAARSYYQPGDIGQARRFRAAAPAQLNRVEGSPCSTRVYYLATAPQFYERGRRAAGRARPGRRSRTARGGSSSKSPSAPTWPPPGSSTRVVHDVFREHQVYRIDHYLGKETVQNILVLRFANTHLRADLEPQLHRPRADHRGRGGDRRTAAAAYYDSGGMLRDMFQNHLLQLLTITAMEAPARFEADAVRDEKVKVLRAIRSLTPERGGHRHAPRPVPRLSRRAGRAADSQTATFAAVKLAIDNWRWQGVPFYLRSGKAMSCRTTQIVIQFRQPPHMIFAATGREHAAESNRLVIQMQPAEGIQLHFQTKVPDAGMKLRLTDLSSTSAASSPAACPRPTSGCCWTCCTATPACSRGPTKWKLAWGIIDPIRAAWEQPAGRRWTSTSPAAGARRIRSNGCAAKAASGSTPARC